MKELDNQTILFERILNDIRQKNKAARPFVAGINGIDLSGKTQFAAALAAFLEKQGLPVTLVHLDDFHNPRHIRRSGDNQVENYYQKGFNLQFLIENLLSPIRSRSAYRTRLTLLDLQSDEYSVQKDFDFPANSIVLIEGVFIFRPELNDFLDYRIYLHISFETMKARSRLRDIPLYGEGILTRYEQKYQPAQEIYIKQFRPAELADIVIDNNDPLHPLLLSQKSSKN